jgi:hypothetical protein
VKPNPKFANIGKDFWANVRTISEDIGYTTRTDRTNPESGQVKIPTIKEMRHALSERNLSSNHVADELNNPTEFGAKLLEYFTFRANILNSQVQKHLMTVDEAREVFDNLYAETNPPKSCPLPYNKQKNEKKARAYFTCIINMLVWRYTQGRPCSYDPRKLTAVTKDNKPLRTMARRVDGAFPATVNPIAIWEIKEYYYTTTFGSRIADGVYESLLDGMELEEIREHEGLDVKHYLMIDAKLTWWDMGKSYLCRLLDMLHMGYVDEVLFGREVVTALPNIVNEWVLEYDKRPRDKPIEQYLL